MVLSYYSFPDMVILNELCNVPSPDSIVELCDRYGVTGNTCRVLANLINPTWRDIKYAMLDTVKSQHVDKNSLDLFNFVTLRDYGNNSPISYESLTILKNFSNESVSTMYDRYFHDDVTKTAFKQFDTEAFNSWLYSRVVVDYCCNILPRPIAPRLASPTILRSLSKVLYSEKLYRGSNSNEYTKMVNLSLALERRFTAYVPAMKVVTNDRIDDAVKASQIAKDWRHIDSKGFGADDKKFRDNAKQIRTAKSKDKLPPNKAESPSRDVLCQCLYCWNFRILPSTHQGNIDRFCGDRCKHSQNSREAFHTDNRIPMY